MRTLAVLAALVLTVGSGWPAPVPDSGAAGVPDNGAPPGGTAVVAVFDHVAGDRAVLVLERGNGTVGTVLVAISALPPPGRHPDAVFRVRPGGGASRLVYDPVTTRLRERALQARFDRLADPVPAGNGTGYSSR